LIFAVRDPVIESRPIQKNKSAPIEGYQNVVIDAGITDKRLLVVEGEYAQALQVMSRQGNTLSPVLRQSWDTGTLNTLTKNSKNTATGAHISVLGHITLYELEKLLQDAEIYNGLGNRALWVCAKRSKSLPDGAEVPEQIISKLVASINDVMKFVGCGIEKEDTDEQEITGSIAIEERKMQRDTEATVYWRAIYDNLTQDTPGMLGAITGRAVAQVLRLSMIYALLDCSDTVKRVHIEAAQEVWRYCEDSAAYIFSERTGNMVAEEILISLGSGPKTQTEIIDLFDRNKPATLIRDALSKLLEQGKVEREKRENYDGKGRRSKPVTVWSKK